MIFVSTNFTVIDLYYIGGLIFEHRELLGTLASIMLFQILSSMVIYVRIEDLYL